MGKIKINGKEFEFNQGETIYTVAKRNDIFIPVLCYHSQLRIVSTCGICVVEARINGKNELLNSCSQLAEEGMEVLTDSEKVLEKRKKIIKSLISNHPVYCPLCNKNGDCLLQDYSALYGEIFEEYKYEKEIKEYTINSLIKFCPDLCIFCERCNRFWKEELNEGEIVSIDVKKRDVKLLKDKDILKGFLNYLPDICPTGAFSFISKSYAKPWDLEKIDTHCVFCSVFCEIRLYIKKKTRTRSYEGGKKFLPDKIYDIKYQNKGLIDSIICDDAKLKKDFISGDKILKKAKIEGKWKEINCEEIVSNLKSKLKKYSKEEIGIILSSNMGNEEIDSLKKFFVNEKKIKNFLLIPGFFDSSFNLMKSDFKIEDVEDDTFILHTGYDFFNSHPVIGFEILRRSRKFKKLNLFSISFEEGKIKKETKNFLLTDFKNAFRILKVIFKELYIEFGVKKEIEEEFLNSFLFLRKIENLNKDKILKELNFDKMRFSKIIKDIMNSKRLIVIYEDFIPFEIQKLCYSFKYIKFPVKILILRMWQNTEYFIRRKFPIIDICEFKDKIEKGIIKMVIFLYLNPFLFIKDDEFLKKIFERCETFVFDFFTGIHTDLSKNVIPLKTFYEKEVKVMDNFCNIKEIKKVFESERIYLPEIISKLKEKEYEEINFEEKIEIDLEKDFKEEFYYFPLCRFE